MEAHLERHAGFLVLRVAGDLRLYGHHDEEDRPLNLLRAEKEHPKQIILSLAGITRLDTAGIRMLVRVVIECTKHNIEAKLVMPGGVAGQAMRHLHVFDAWPEFSDEAAAIEAAQIAAAAE